MGSGGKFFSLLVLIVSGAILADFVIHSNGTKAFFGGIGNLWSTSLNGVLGQPTKAGG